MKIKDLTMQFNPNAEIWIKTGNDGFTYIDDIEWTSDTSINKSLTGVKKSKENASAITLITAAKLPKVIYSTSLFNTKIEYDGRIYVDESKKVIVKQNEQPKNGTLFVEGTMSPHMVIGNELHKADTWEHPEKNLGNALAEDPVFLDSNKCVLSCKFKVKKIKYKSTLVDDLEIKVGHLLTIDYNLTNTYKNGKNGAQYATIYNSFNGKSKQISLNKLARMINDGMEIYRMI